MKVKFSTEAIMDIPELGIFEGDKLLIDPNIEPKENSIVATRIGEARRVDRFGQHQGEIMGVVTGAVRNIALI